MFKFLVGILLFFGLIILLVTSLGISLLRSLFGSARRSGQKSDEPVRPHTSGDDRDKIFGNQEGEYVDFEEIKDDQKKDEVK